MASNTSEGEERMIALLTQLVENNSNDDSDRLAQTANSLSTAAMAVSIVALAIGLLQALLQYASSNENHREKCNIGAIGRAAMLSGTSTWSWWQWRRKYTYPVLDLSHWNVVHCLPGGKHDLNYLPTIFKDAVLPYTPLPKKDDLGPGGALVWWENWSKWDYGETIEYGPWRLYRIGQNVPPKMVSPKDLPLLQQLRWHWHSRLRKRDERLTPRATWAQLLETFGIFDIRPLVLRRMDAECIPSSVDVPTQKIALADLGILAFHLKMTTVAIDVTERTFLATGPCGSISTEDLPSFGKVVRFQSHGDFNPGFRSSLLRQDKKYQLLGDLCFGFATGTISVTTRSLERSRRDWARITERIPYFLALETKGIELSTSAISESESWEKLGSLSSWREEHKLLNVAWPTIFLAATTACLPGETVGFPSQIMLRPFLECLGHWAKGIRDRCGLPVELIRSGRPDSLDSIVLGQLQCQDLCMTDVTHVQEPEAVLDVCELSSWAFWQIDTQTLKEVELSLCREEDYSQILMNTVGLNTVFLKQMQLREIHRERTGSSTTPYLCCQNMTRTLGLQGCSKTDIRVSCQRNHRMFSGHKFSCWISPYESY